METESIKVSTKILEKVRKNKKAKGVSIQAFYDQAAEEKLKRDRKKT